MSRVRPKAHWPSAVPIFRRFVFSTTHTDSHLTEIAALIAPQGRLALIDDPKTLDINPFKRKAVNEYVADTPAESATPAP